MTARSCLLNAHADAAVPGLASDADDRGLRRTRDRLFAVLAASNGEPDNRVAIAGGDEQMTWRDLRDLWLASGR